WALTARRPCADQRRQGESTGQPGREKLAFGAGLGYLRRTRGGRGRRTRNGEVEGAGARSAAPVGGGRIMKRWSLSLGLLACAALAGCAAMSGSSTASSPSPVIDRIVKSGELRVGTSGTQPPLSATAKDGSLMGFDIEIANQIAKAMGVKLTLVPMD